MTLHVELVSPEEILFSGDADMVICRTTDGEIAFLTGHAPFVGALGIGPVKSADPTTPTTWPPCTAGSSRSAMTRSRSCPTWRRWPARSTCSGPSRPGRAEALRDHHDGEAEAALRRAHVRIELAQDRQTRTG